MPILRKSIDTLKTNNENTGVVSSVLKSVGRAIVNTPKRIAGAITGGPRRQTYGYFADLFPETRKYTKKERVTQIRRTPTTPTLAPNFGSSSESLNDIFKFMKSSQEKQILQLEVQKSFNEERSTEDQRRHKELLDAIKEFVSTPTVTRVETEKSSDGGILDGLKSMIEGIVKNAIAAVEKVIEGIKTTLETLKTAYDLLKPYISTIGRFFTSPLFMSILGPALLIGSLAAFLKSAADEKSAIEANPYDAKYKDNSYARVLRNEVSSVAQGAEVNRRMTVKQIPRREVEEVATSTVPDENVKAMYGQDKAGLTKWLRDNPNEKMYQASVAPIAGKPTTGVMAGGNPLPVKPTALPEGVTASTASGGRSSAEAAATDPRRLDTATPAPSTPMSATVSAVSEENKDLEDNRNVPSGTTPIITTQNSTQTKKSSQIPSTATQRDDEPMASHVFDKHRLNTRAY